MKIKYSEIFGSFQGEGNFAGMPSVWVRLFGCNLECSGFGQADPTKPETYILPFKDINLDDIKTVEELPVFEYGCDSSYSWSNRFKNLAKTAEVGVVVDMILDTLKKSFNTDSWQHPITNQPIQLCFTGGEPMLWQKQVLAIMQELRSRILLPYQITVETNGTKPIVELDSVFSMTRVNLACSPKLFTVSGEKDAVNIDILRQYMLYSDSGCLKFVHNGSEAAWTELMEHMVDIKRIMSETGSNWTLYVMPVGATLEKHVNNKIIADISDRAMSYGFWVATRNHVGVYGNQIGK